MYFVKVVKLIFQLQVKRYCFVVKVKLKFYHFDQLPFSTLLQKIKMLNYK